VTYLCRQHTRCYEEFFDEVRRKGAKLDKRMVYENKKGMREFFLNEPPGWILGTIKSELNLFELSGNETLEDL
jgi:hypothetical protein